MEALVKIIQKQFDKMCQTGRLFRCDIEGDLLWKTYLSAFDKDPIWRAEDSSVHNCQYCRSFIDKYASVVAIDKQTLEIVSMFDIPLDEVPEEYKNSIDALSQVIHKNGKIKDIFVETYSYLSLDKTPFESNPKKNQESYHLGVEKNIKRYTKEDVDRWPNAPFKINDTYTYRHMWVSIPRKFIDFSGASKESLMAAPRQTKEVFKKGLDTISVDTMQLVLDLEAQGSLLNGAASKHIVQKALDYAKQYQDIPKEKKDNFCWVASLEWGPGAGFKNSSIGTLLEDLSQGRDLNEACESYNSKVDPINYKRCSAPITQKMIDSAEKFVEENGYSDSLIRRCATIEDIKVSDILHSNQEAGQVKTKLSVFDGLAASAPTRHKKAKFDNVEEVSIEKFMNDILPNCSSVEAYLDNNHEDNFVTLITAENKDSKRLFGWDNNFSWTYNGGLAGKSQLNLKQAVQQRGGSVTGVIRFTHSWNELEPNQSLMDAHVFMPGYNEKYNRNCINDEYPKTRRVGWNRRNDYESGGVQDVDYVNEAPEGYIPVENITFPDIKKMPEGTYIYKIHNWNFRKTGGRGRAEIAFGGKVYQYIYPATKHKEWVTVARVTLKDGQFSIEHVLPVLNEQPQEVFGLQTLEFHKVDLICLSPNFWQEHGVGNKHYFFMLAGAHAPEDIRTLHNEYLNQSLREHRKVFEYLGAKLKCKSTKNQLSGLGFNATVHDELIVRCKGSFQRVLKIKF